MSSTATRVVLFAWCLSVGAAGAPLEHEDLPALWRLLTASGVERGLVVHLGCGDGGLMAELHAGDQRIVHGLDPDPRAVAEARVRLQARGLHGRVSAQRWSGGELPYVGNLVNVLFVFDPGRVPTQEIVRVLAPRAIACVRKGSEWEQTTKPWPRGLDEWTHFHHGPDNNAVSKDLRVGPPARTQWMAGPRWARSHEITPSLQGMVSAAGRIFYAWDRNPIGMFDERFPANWTLMARDAFNGALLWQRPIRRWGPEIGWLGYPSSMNARMAATSDRVFVGLGDGEPVTALCATTGESLRVFEGTGHCASLVLDRGVLAVADGASGTVVACDSETGARLWTLKEAGSPAMSGGLACVRAGDDIVAVDGATGKERWRTTLASPRASELRPAALRPAKSKPVALRPAKPAPVMHKDLVFVPDAVLSALDARDGAVLWQWPPKGETPPIQRPVFSTPSQVFIAGGLAWPFACGIGLDPRTGEEIRRIQTDWTHAHHHRCHPCKATDRFLITSYRGAEFFDLDGRDPARLHDWLRGTCRLGVVPANGLLYVPPHSCLCYAGTKLIGFHALAAGAEPELPADSDATRWETEAPDARKPEAVGPSPWIPCDAGGDWPMYRHDAARSGATAAEVAPDAARSWVLELGARLTPPVAALGMVFVAAPEACEVHAVTARDGRRAWCFAAGATVDSPPSIVARAGDPGSALCVFGCSDGWVYALRVTDGTPAWRFRVAPKERWVAREGRVESAWPVPGSALVQDGVIHAVAGHSSFLDGGLWACGLDPGSGRPRYEKRIYDQGMTSTDFSAHDTAKGALNDILVGDGSGVCLGRLELGPRPARPGARRLFVTSGFLDDTYFNRSWWAFTQSYPPYSRKPVRGPRGQLLVFKGTDAFGVRVFRRVSKLGGRSPDFSPGEGYEVFGVRPAEQGDGVNPEQDTWTTNLPLRVRAMTLAGSRLFVAGAPDRIDADDLM